MPDADTAAPADPDLRPGRPSGGRRWWAPALAVVLLGAPPLFHAVGADLVTLALLWGATALQFRSRLTVLDRLVLAAGLLTGWCCLLGVLASYWPWGLRPVALGEATALPLALLLLTVNRQLAVRPDLRRRLRLPLGDCLLLLVLAAAGWFYLRPLLTVGVTGRLAALYHGEDLARHFALYDSVLRFGGYLTVHRAQAAVTLQDGFQSYPQGSHLTLAVLTEFADSGAVPPDSLTALGTFTVLAAGVLTAFVGAVLWAVRRAAGPALGEWAVLPLCVAVGGYLVLVEATPLLLVGFESELFGLALFVLLVALVCRPVGRAGEQLLLLGSLTVGIAFSYYLLLAAAGPLLLVWALVHRRRWRRLWPAAAVTVVLTGAAAALPVLANWKQAGSAAVLVQPGGVLPVSRHLLLPLIALAVLGLLTGAARRNAVRRAALGGVAVVGAVAVALMRYQVAAAGRTSYYYEKLLHPLFVVTLVALGAAAVPLCGALGRRRLRWPGRAAWAVAVSAALFLSLALNAKPDHGGPTSADVYRHGKRAAPASATLVTAVYATRPVPDPRIGVLLVDPHGGEDPRFAEGNLWLGVLARDNGLSWRAWIWGRWRRSAQEIVDFADASPVPLRVYLDDPALAAQTVGLAGPGRLGRLDVALIRYDAQDRPVVVDPFEGTPSQQE
ncbi:hypothetical protein [Kitasatospora sp. MAP5-34]|uniref:hypothetical protein n=1 Tax=Kitasatospora sp. MAP5-34 TaxID=3035102 RepID=UPI0024748729|nr:hypothetical protein [Kitasatospora sp. MAP5-34]MDH6580142.1 hypothetical protein [Kitasatospora sp. MAP5-34]